MAVACHSCHLPGPPLPDTSLLPCPWSLGSPSPKVLPEVFCLCHTVQFLEKSRGSGAEIWNTRPCTKSVPQFSHLQTGITISPTFTGLAGRNDVYQSPSMAALSCTRTCIWLPSLHSHLQKGAPIFFGGPISFTPQPHPLSTSQCDRHEPMAPPQGLIQDWVCGPCEPGRACFASLVSARMIRRGWRPEVQFELLIQVDLTLSISERAGKIQPLA